MEGGGSRRTIQVGSLKADHLSASLIKFACLLVQTTVLSFQYQFIPDMYSQLTHNFLPLDCSPGAGATERNRTVGKGTKESLPRPISSPTSNEMEPKPNLCAFGLLTCICSDRGKACVVIGFEVLAIDLWTFRCIVLLIGVRCVCVRVCSDLCQRSMS